MKKRSVKIAIFLGLFALVSPCRAHSDVYMKQRQSSSGAPTTSGNEESVDEIWMTQEGVRKDNPKKSMIMPLNENKIYKLDHENKTYTEMSLNIGQEMEEAMGDTDENEKAMFKGFMQNMVKMEALVEPTGETKRIRNWNCKKYLLTLTTMMGPSHQEIWAAPEIKIDEALYERFRSAETAMMPGMQESMAQMAAEMKKIKGVQVENTSTQKVMNKTVTTVTELLEFRQAQAPGGLFKLPDDYKKVSEPTNVKQKRPSPGTGKARMPGLKLNDFLK